MSEAEDRALAAKILGAPLEECGTAWGLVEIGESQVLALMAAAREEGRIAGYEKGRDDGVDAAVYDG